MPRLVQEAVVPVARNARRLREQRGASLSAVAAAAGISKSTLFKLERGEGNPSVDTLWALAKALRVPVAALFAEDDEAAVDVLRFADAPLIARRGSRHVRGAAGQGLSMRHLLSRHVNGEIEVYCTDLEAGARREAHPHAAGVIEHAFVVHGRIDLGIEGESNLLDPGDRISFAADRPHHYYAVNGPARAFTLLEYR
jgi:transcriptional regulator with XRE-family HTH domain